MALPPRDVKHVVITGASSGLGAALARAYARPGVTLTLFGRTSSAGKRGRHLYD